MTAVQMKPLPDVKCPRCGNLMQVDQMPNWTENLFANCRSCHLGIISTREELEKGLVFKECKDVGGEA